MHAEAERAAYVERTRGVDAAGRGVGELTARYPWSLGLLEDRLAFLGRARARRRGARRPRGRDPAAAAGPPRGRSSSA